MTLTLPSYLDEAKYIVGFEFPQADEDALRRCAQAWRTAAGGARAVQGESAPVGGRVDRALGGESGAAFQSVWQQVARPDSGFLDQLARACDQMANACEHAAVEVEYAKYEFIGALALLAGTLAVLVALLFAGGLSAGGIPIAVATAQTTIRAVLTRLIASVVVAEMYSLGLDALGQGIQLLAGHRRRWDWAKTGRAAEDGAIYGVVNAGTFGLAGKAAPRLLRTLTGRTIVAGVAGASGTGTSAAIHGDVPTGKDFLLSLSSGLAQGVPDGVHGRLEAADSHVRVSVTGLDRFEESTVDGLAGLSERRELSAPDGTVLARSTIPDDQDMTRRPTDASAAIALDRAHADTTPRAGARVVEPVAVLGPSDRTAGPDNTTGFAHLATLAGSDPPREVVATPEGAAPPATAGGPASASPSGFGHAGSTESHATLTSEASPDEQSPPRPAAVEHPDAGRTGEAAALAPPDRGPTGEMPASPAASSSVIPWRHGDGPAPVSAADAVRVSTSDTRVAGEVASAPGPGPFPQLADEEVHDLVYGNVFATDAGLAFYADGDSTRDFARAVEPTPGYVTLDLHGATDGFYIDGHRLTPEQFARSLRELYADGVLDLPEGAGVKLLSCDTAFGGDGSPAAKLARALGVEVIAPDRVVWTSMAGLEIVSSPMLLGGYIIPTYPPDGGWHRFAPNGDELGLSFDPGYHGPPVNGNQPLSQFEAASSDRLGHADVTR